MIQIYIFIAKYFPLLYVDSDNLKLLIALKRSEIMYNKIIVLPAVLVLSACGGGGTTTALTSQQSLAQLLTLPTAETAPTETQTFDDLRLALGSASEGDAFTLPLSALDPAATGSVTAVVGKSVGGITTVTTELDSGQGFVERGITISSNLAELTVGDTSPAGTVYSSQSFTINGVNILVGGGSDAETGYNEMFANTTLNDNNTEAEVKSFIVDGLEVSTLSISGAGAFSKPAGIYDFTGKAIVAGDDNLLIGDAAMTANFDTNTGTVSASDLASADDSSLSAAFVGNFIIDSTSGHYTGTDATISFNDTNYDAAVMGTFNADATQSSGVVFGIEDIPTGMFSVARDTP